MPIRPTGSTGLEPAQYSYDNYGNITSDGTRTFTYNLNNRLSRVSEGTTTIAEYSYDGQNRRVFKTVSGITTYFHYDLTGNLIAETSATGSPQRDIIYQDGERVAMKVYGTNPEIYWFINDHLGTSSAVVNDSGQVVWKAAYFPFGKAEILVNTIENNFRLPGQYYDAETGFHYNMNRYYDPDSGRYVSADPIGLSGGLNLYVYAGNDPVNFVDQWGLNPLVGMIEGAKIGGSVGGLAGGIVGATIGAAGGLLIIEMSQGGDGTIDGAEWDEFGPKDEECIEEVSDHAKDRQNQATEGDSSREVGDPNRVVQEGKQYIDSDTGHTVHVKGNRVVVTDGSGRQITQFKNTRKNTNSRVRSGKWTPR